MFKANLRGSPCSRLQTFSRARKRPCCSTFNEAEKALRYRPTGQRNAAYDPLIERSEFQPCLSVLLPRLCLRRTCEARLVQGFKLSLGQGNAHVAALSMRQKKPCVTDQLASGMLHMTHWSKGLSSSLACLFRPCTSLTDHLSIQKCN